MAGWGARRAVGSVLAIVAISLTACSANNGTTVGSMGGAWAYVTSSDGIVPFNLTTHRTGHAITVPL